MNQKKDEMLLYLDTSEPEAVLGLYSVNKSGFVLTKKWLAARELSRTLEVELGSLLSEAGLAPQDLSGMVVFTGPGTFTGLRIGISFANGLCFALKIPIFETTEREVVNLENPKEIVLPFYGAEPNITKPKEK